MTNNNAPGTGTAAADPEGREPREQKTRTKITVGNYAFKIDVSEIAFKKVGKSTATVKGQPYVTGRLSLPREWIGKQVIVMAIDDTDDGNSKSMKDMQAAAGPEE